MAGRFVDARAGRVAFADDKGTILSGGNGEEASGYKSARQKPFFAICVDTTESFR